MHEVVLVDVRHSCHCLIHDALYLRLPEYAVAICPFLELLIQILIAVLKYNIDFVFLSIMDHLKYFYDEYTVV